MAGSVGAWATKRPKPGVRRARKPRRCYTRAASPRGCLGHPRAEHARGHDQAPHVRDLLHVAREEPFEHLRPEGRPRPRPLDARGPPAAAGAQTEQSCRRSARAAGRPEAVTRRARSRDRCRRPPPPRWARSPRASAATPEPPRGSGAHLGRRQWMEPRRLARIEGGGDRLLEHAPRLAGARGDRPQFLLPHWARAAGSTRIREHDVGELEPGPSAAGSPDTAMVTVSGPTRTAPAPSGRS